MYTSLTGGQASDLGIHYHKLSVPKAITAILVGMGLSISGLLMQTLFRNPLAGPMY
jgi:iron complex transport system permease protein